MRRNPTKRIERYRITVGPLASDASYGGNGAFQIPYENVVVLLVIASDGSDWSEAGLPGMPWEHVSVSLSGRCPEWQEMDFVKRLFWGDDELVVQFHVPREQHINEMDTCLHLWKPPGPNLPLPPSVTVGARKIAK